MPQPEVVQHDVQAKWALPVWRWLLVGPHDDAWGLPVLFAIYPRKA